MGLDERATTLLQRAVVEFGSAIRASREWRAYTEAEEAFGNDDAARALLRDLQEAQQTLSIFRQGEFPGQAEQRERVLRLRDQVQRNRVIIDWVSAEEAMRTLVGELAVQLSNEIKFPFALPRQGGGCCG